VHIEEGPFTLGAAGDQPMPVVLKNNFHNVPNSGVLGPWAPGSPGNKHPEQFYMSAPCQEALCSRILPVASAMRCF
jgi:hypothetical protein